MAWTYLPRVADGELADRLSSAGAVLIEGPKACGKTATASRVARSIVRLDVDPGSRGSSPQPQRSSSTRSHPSCLMSGRSNRPCGTSCADRSTTGRR